MSLLGEEECFCLFSEEKLNRGTWRSPSDTTELFFMCMIFDCFVCIRKNRFLLFFGGGKMLGFDKTVIMVMQKRHQRPYCLMLTKLSVSCLAEDKLDMKDCANPLTSRTKR